MSSSRTAVITAIAADVAIAVGKFTAFLFTRSAAMLSESVHSLVDASNSSLLLLGLHRSHKPADESHPFGYGKELYFWTLLVAIFIFLVGGGVSVAEGTLHLLHPEPIAHPLWNYVTLLLAACFEGYSLHVGLREFKAAEGVSASLKAIHASKDPSTFTVIIEDFAAILGLAVALLGTLASQFLHLDRADGIASVLIGLILMAVSVLLIVESKALLIGEGTDLSTLREIRRLALAVPGVDRVGYPLTMVFGPGNILLTMNVRFADHLAPTGQGRQNSPTTRDGIEHIVDRIEASIRQSFPQIQHIYLEAESLKASDRLSDPAYPAPTDLPPSLK